MRLDMVAAPIMPADLASWGEVARDGGNGSEGEVARADEGGAGAGGSAAILRGQRTTIATAEPTERQTQAAAPRRSFSEGGQLQIARTEVGHLPVGMTGAREEEVSTH